MDLNRKHFLKTIAGVALAPVAAVSAAVKPAAPSFLIRLAEFVDANAKHDGFESAKTHLMLAAFVYCRHVPTPDWLASDPDWIRFTQPREPQPEPAPKPAEPQPTEAELVERYTHSIDHGERLNLAADLGAARRTWAKYPELVQAPKFDAELLEVYRTAYGEDPCLDTGITPRDPEWPAELLRRARESARRHLAA